MRKKFTAEIARFIMAQFPEAKFIMPSWNASGDLRVEINFFLEPKFVYDHKRKMFYREANRETH